MASESETVAEVLAEFGKNIELMRKCKCVGVSLWSCLKYKLRIEAAHKREVAELRECLKEAVDFVCEKSHRDCGRCVREGRFDCPGEKWRKALEGENDEH